ncbi:aldehyde dehydrogenase family protein [Streptomyces jumonjinensis]|uniref:Aldehyde dehydrogenase family protein n=1 Tax=Streptomyces jumonjinensis TaxID=1945 RepID=A0A646KCW1_STRJU|nr:aldehyde dehydrogenase family protein [Streptomyces jumonjinensis]MQS99937.1 aldehyde dehydrogenase family protein [Streptomyces jumonjinensis]
MNAIPETESTGFTLTLTIGGAAVAAPATCPVVNPIDESVVAHAPSCSDEQLDQAVSAARNALPAWSATPFDMRRKLLSAVADAVETRVGPLARLLTAEQGKPLADAAGEIRGFCWWLRETAALTLPETVNEDSPDRLSITRHVPVGVVGAIVPWNYPIGNAAFKIGPALLAGCTVVWKPSPFTPLTSLKVGELLRGVLPPGVLNVVSGEDGLGPRLTSHPGIDMISYTGSTPTGRRVMAGAAPRLKRVTLELGGNDPAIVFPDVDVDDVAAKLFWGAFANSGQVCLAIKRLYIHRDVHEPLKRALAAYAASVTVGDGTEPGVRLGPVQNRRQYDRVVDLLRDSRQAGHDLLLGGFPADGPGYLVPLTLVDNPPDDARIVREEQFGPVLPLLRFDDVEDAVARANAGEYGLGASVWSADAEAAASVGRRLRAGTVWINEVQHLSPHVTFGGHKQSGLGTEGGQEGLLDYTLPQTITIRRR